MPVAPGIMFGYAESACDTTTPGVAVVRLARMLVALVVPLVKHYRHRMKVKQSVSRISVAPEAEE